MSCDPRLDEFCRAHELRTHFFRNVQTHIRTVVIPQLEERERLLVEVAALRAKVAAKAEKPKKELAHAGT